MPTKAERKAAKKADREAKAQRVVTNPSEAILGKPVAEDTSHEPNPENVEPAPEASEPAPEETETKPETT
ncbi:hypothetical protein LCGC14_2680250, partial [marine sediment metagenome]